MCHMIYAENGMGTKNGETCVPCRICAASEPAYPEKIAEALAIIQSSYERPISLQSVADDIGISAGYLSRLFLSAMGHTFTETLNRERIEQAKILLTDGTLPAYRVGEMVGIGNATYFIRVFRKYTGQTPNEYRRGL